MQNVICLLCRLFYVGGGDEVRTVLFGHVHLCVVRRKQCGEVRV